MKRKTITGIMITLFFTGILFNRVPVVTRASPMTTFYVAPSSIIDPVLTPGNLFTVNINVSDAVDFYAWQVRMDWDSAVLNATNIVFGDFLTDQPAGSVQAFHIYNEEDQGLLVAETTIGQYPGVDGDGWLCSIEFLVETSGETVLNIDSEYTYWVDSALNKYGDNPDEMIKRNGYFSNQYPHIYIRADGSVDPPTAPISSVDNITYTFTNNISSFIVVERNNIVVEGAGYSVQGPGDGRGIDLSGRSNVTITNMEIKAFDYGIYLDQSSNNNIQGNNMTDNYCGIGLYSNSSGNNLRCNTVTNNHNGIELGTGSNNTICENAMANNTYGILLGWAIHNIMRHNNFINNAWQAHFASTRYENTWDDGYPSGGNYWSDYEDRYPDAEERNDSGIWNTPYVIDPPYGFNVDNYPLMNPIHEINVTMVQPRKTLVGQGYSLRIEVEVANQGRDTETFELTLYANTIIIDTFTGIVLTSGDSATITFTWDTTGFAKGSYTISAHATPVLGEIYIADNTYTDGTVLVTIAGDVNGDGSIDIFDLSTVGMAYGKREGWPGYNPYADITEDGIIDARDLAVVCYNWGESDP